MQSIVLLSAVLAVCNGAAIQNDDIIAIGDMLFTKKSYADWINPGRSFQTSANYQWPKDTQGYTIIPYVMDSSLLSTDIPNILAGMQQWSSTTCVKFVDNAVAQSSSYVRVQMPPSSSACNSYVGNIKAGTNGQSLNLGKGCATPPIAAHEFGHAIGLSHEQCRADRDQYLVLFLNNVAASQLNNFNMDSSSFNNFSIPYNYLSVMHYFWNSFAIDSTKPTMLPKDPTMEIYLTSNNPVSHYDALLVNRALNCSAVFSQSCASSPPVCQNYGYLNANCQCTCPPGTTGNFCETLTVASLPVYPPIGNYQCGGQVTAPTANISVPLYQATPARNMTASCIWWIRKPATATTVTVTMNSFNMYKKYTDGTCYYEYLELRTQSLYISDGQRYCATDIAAGTNISSTGDIVMKFVSKVLGNTGFNFSVSFS